MAILVSAEPCLGKDLKPGDLFSTVGSDYWETAIEGPSIGERVYIRTNYPHDPDDANTPVYRITIE